MNIEICITVGKSEMASPRNNSGFKADRSAFSSNATTLSCTKTNMLFCVQHIHTILAIYRDRMITTNSWGTPPLITTLCVGRGN